MLGKWNNNQSKLQAYLAIFGAFKTFINDEGKPYIFGQGGLFIKL